MQANSSLRCEAALKNLRATNYITGMGYHKYSIEEAFRECFYIVPDYPTHVCNDFSRSADSAKKKMIN